MRRASIPGYASLLGLSLLLGLAGPLLPAGPAGQQGKGPDQAGALDRREVQRRILEYKGRKAIKGLDAKNWGEDLPNPFTALPESTRDQLTARGVDVKRLLKLEARLITGEYCGAGTFDLVNKDPDTNGTALRHSDV